MKTCGSIFSVITAVTALAETPAPSQPMSATIDASKTGAAISPYLYGQFVEHAGNLVYTGLWSEMLDDRKFSRSCRQQRRHRRPYEQGVGPGEGAALLGDGYPSARSS
jgi:hypothetical protein